MYRVELQENGIDDQLAYNVLNADLLVNASTETGEQLDTPQWDHPGDFEVTQVQENSLAYDLEGGTGLPTATFDGGAAQKLGVGGFTFSGSDSVL